MKTKRFREYLQHKKATRPIRHKEEVAQNPDKRIDQDFSGYPHGHAKEKIIRPQTKKEKKTAALQVKDGEKMNNTAGRSSQRDEQDSDGSGGAFATTEDLID